MSEPEPRRSVRATKGQHQHRDLDDVPAKAPRQRQTRKGGRNAAANPVSARAAKATEEDEEDEEEEEEEVIRCVCGATSQDEDSDVAWIACDKCGVWQHNVCMKISTFDEDIPDKYSCEQCDPGSHTELLEGMARGERPWEERQQRHESEKSERKKRRGGRKSTKKRISDPKAVLAAAKKTESSPAPPDTPSEKAEPRITIGKRKAKDQEKDVQTPAPKLRKISISGQTHASASPPPQETTPSAPSVAPNATPGSRSESKTRPESRASFHHEPPSEPEPAAPAAEPQTPQAPAPTPQTSPAQSQAVTNTAHNTYEAPADLAKSISELPDNRKGPASALFKSLVHALEEAVRTGNLTTKDQAGVKPLAIRLALEVERALHDACATAKDYASQARTLAFNIKRNPELSIGLLRRTLPPTILAHMKSEQLASKEFQKEIQGIREKVEKQSIRITTDAPPRTRHTHKGEELVDNELFLANEETPSVIRRPSLREPPSATTTSTPIQQTPVQQSPKASDFDLGKVFSSVKSPAVGHVRRTSTAVANANGPGEDADVDRMLQGETESPPYSPKEDTDEVDTDVVWRGRFTMSTIADFPCAAKWAAGANLNTAVGLPWSELFNNDQVGIMGRIETSKALPYLCGLRYNARADVIVVSIEPSAPGYEAQFRSVVNYFVSKQRYGVVNSKGPSNLRDTYLIPVPVEEENYPEFLLNLFDNNIPRQARTEPALLVVFIYMDAPDGSASADGHAHSYSADRIFSPATPHPGNGAATQQTNGRFSNALPTNDASPPRPLPPSTNGNGPQHEQAPPPPPHTQQQQQAANLPAALVASQNLAQQILGPELASSPTLPFLLANARSMTRKEWDTLKHVYEQDPRARHDLGHLSAVIARAAAESDGQPAL